MSWTKKDLDRLNLKHNFKENKNKSNVLVKKNIINGKISAGKKSIKTLLWVLKREGMIENYVEELQFDDVRKFRFDWALPDLKIAIEYEGIFSKKSRHTTIKGFTTDCEKYNLAQIMGWKVLRYTANNYQNIEKDLKKLLIL
ncbi:hypothetical protein [Changchengzhania lutea]|uniref:hypothetical protein n=1 Tax=Changchengzhania lutea TaxID=2049305 RepID=UPI00115EEB72|nr:hypothetical protein [Changchengzhania lutea]